MDPHTETNARSGGTKENFLRTFRFNITKNDRAKTNDARVNAFYRNRTGPPSDLPGGSRPRFYRASNEASRLSVRGRPPSLAPAQLNAAMGHNFLLTCFTSSMGTFPICSAVPISLTNFMNSTKMPGSVR